MVTETTSGAWRPLRKRMRPAYLGLPGWNVGLVVLVAAVFLWASLEAPGFLDKDQLLAAGQAQTVIGLLALGLAIVVLVGEIDISLTSNLAFCTVVTGLLAGHGVPGAVLIVVSLSTGVALGLFNGLLVAWFGLPSLAVTLGTMGAYQGGAYLLGGNTGFTKYPSSVTYLGSGSIASIPVSIIVFASLAIVFALMLWCTTVGRGLYAVGRAQEVVRRSGISVIGHKTAAFGFGGLSAGLAALVFVGYYGSGGGSSASNTILLVVTAVALGGVDIYGGSGRISGVVLAVVLVAALQDGMGLLNVDTTLQTIVIGLLLLISLTLSRLMGAGILTANLLRRPSKARSPSGP